MRDTQRADQREPPRLNPVLATPRPARRPGRPGRVRLTRSSCACSHLGIGPAAITEETDLASPGLAGCLRRTVTAPLRSYLAAVSARPVGLPGPVGPADGRISGPDLLPFGRRPCPGVVVVVLALRGRRPLARPWSSSPLPWPWSSSPLPGLWSSFSIALAVVVAFALTSSPLPLPGSSPLPWPWSSSPLPWPCSSPLPWPWSSSPLPWPWSSSPLPWPWSSPLPWPWSSSPLLGHGRRLCLGHGRRHPALTVVALA